MKASMFLSYCSVYSSRRRGSWAKLKPDEQNTGRSKLVMSRNGQTLVYIFANFKDYLILAI